ncbi:MAG: nucleotidyltransferase family protein [Gammaproteobacteria bacterium]|nr:nucleotidyltransferase family protein [Gammaproteobacteria bacterium]
MKAMILAAGRGARLRPLTDNCPKPLLPVSGRPLIVHQIEALAASGFTNLVINIAYQADMFPKILGDGSQWGVSIQYSVEPESAYETGGGIYHALEHLGDYFLVVSADIFTSYPYHTLRKPPERIAHLVMVDPLPTGGDFALSEGLLSLDGSQLFTYGNIGVLRKELFDGCKPGVFPLGNLLRSAISQQQITGEYFQGRWYNVGTVETYEEVNGSYLPL